MGLVSFETVGKERVREIHVTEASPVAQKSTWKQVVLCAACGAASGAMSSLLVGMLN